MFALPARRRWDAPESFDMFVDEFVPPIEIVFCPREEGEGREGKGSIRNRVRRRFEVKCRYAQKAELFGIPKICSQRIFADSGVPAG